MSETETENEEVGAAPTLTQIFRRLCTDFVGVCNAYPVGWLHLGGREDDTKCHTFSDTWKQQCSHGPGGGGGRSPSEDRAEAEKGIKLFKVAEITKYLGCHFSSAASNQTRRQCRDKYGAPNTAVMACPTMDKSSNGGCQQ